MVQRPRPDLRGGVRSNAHSYRNSGGYGEIRIPTVTEGRGAAMPPPTRPSLCSGSSSAPSLSRFLS